VTVLLPIGQSSEKRLAVGTSDALLSSISAARAVGRRSAQLLKSEN
jgi:hypothetical protein